MVDSMQQDQINVDKQIAKDIVITIISHSSPELLFKEGQGVPTLPKFEILWERVFRTVSASK